MINIAEILLEVENGSYVSHTKAMTNEEKELLLKDLCARLSYGVLLDIPYKELDGKIYNMPTELDGEIFDLMKDDDECLYKPHLRPMSSMSEDEKKCLEELCTMYNGGIKTDYESFGIKILITHPIYGDSFSQDFTVFDWLNAHHFDYRGLIEKGLALEAPEGMYNN